MGDATSPILHHCLYCYNRCYSLSWAAPKLGAHFSLAMNIYVLHICIYLAYTCASCDRPILLHNKSQYISIMLSHILNRNFRIGTNQRG